MFMSNEFDSFVAKPPEPEPNPSDDEEEAGQKFERGGASILYVHTFCAELLGETSSLELCRWASALTVLESQSSSPSPQPLSPQSPQTQSQPSPTQFQPQKGPKGPKGDWGWH